MTCRSFGDVDRLDRDVLADHAVQHLLDLRDDGVQVHDCGLRDLLAAERQELTGQRTGALSGFLDLFEVGQDVGLVPRALGDERGVAEDGREQVVEVVRHAAGQLADCFHLLRLPELILARAQCLFGRLALGNLGGDAEQVTLGGVGHHQGHTTRLEPALMPGAGVGDQFGQDRHRRAGANHLMLHRARVHDLFDARVEIGL